MLCLKKEKKSENARSDFSIVLFKKKIHTKQPPFSGSEMKTIFSSISIWFSDSAVSSSRHEYVSGKITENTWAFFAFSRLPSSAMLCCSYSNYLKMHRTSATVHAAVKPCKGTTLTRSILLLAWHKIQLYLDVLVWFCCSSKLQT